MNEIINSILEAEKKADEIVKTAQEQSKAIILSSEETAENVRTEAVKSVKEISKKKNAEAEKVALSEYEKVMAEGVKTAEKIKKDAEKKVGQVAGEVFAGLIK